MTERVRALLSPKNVALGLGLVALGGAGLALERSGALEQAALEGLLLSLGCWAVPLFFVLFTAGAVLQVPGALFVVAARLAFGPVWGFVLAYAGAVVAVTAAFGLVRALRGRRDDPPRPLRWRWARRLLDGAQRRPVLTVALLRTLFFLSPPLNYALAFSRIRARDYVLGSALGLALPVFLVTLATGLF